MNMPTTADRFQRAVSIMARLRGPGGEGQRKGGADSGQGQALQADIAVHGGAP